MKEKIITHVKKEKSLYLAFLLPFFMMLGVCIYKKMFPFGDQCFLHIDMYHQYCPFMAEFIDKLQNQGSLFYDWQLGLGADFWGLYAYYLASPMNWLAFLCPKAYVIEFMTLLIFVKIALCGWSFAYYLEKHFQTKSLSVTMFAIFYALSAYTCAYNWNIMWMDGLWLTPLVILGLERLVKDQTPKMYYITLAISILSNYYISVMLCIFLVIYYFVLMLDQKFSGFWKTSIRFAGYSLLAGGTSAVIILPELAILSISGSSGVKWPTYFTWYFNAIDELARSCMNVESVPVQGHWPSIYCGVGTLLLIFLYVMNREISWKKKLPRVLLLAFFLVSFANNWLTFIWHGLDFPDGLPARQAYLYIFLMLTVCYDCLFHMMGNKKLHVGIALVINMLLVLLYAFKADTERITRSSLVLTGILLGVYALLYVMCLAKDKKRKQIAAWFAFLLVIVEATVNLNVTGNVPTSRVAYRDKLPEYEALVAQAECMDDGFYRMEIPERLTKNLSTLVGYRSGTVFSTMLNLKVANIYKLWGMEGGKNYYCTNGATPLSSAMLSIKYRISSSDKESSPLQTLVAQQNGICMYQNNYVLPVGFVVDSDFGDNWYDSEFVSIDVQNQMAYDLGATNALFSEIQTEVKTKDTTIHVEEAGYVMGYYWDKRIKTLNAEYSDGRTKKFVKCDHVYLIDLGWCEAGTDIKLTSPDINVVQVQGEIMNMEAFEQAYHTLNQNTMEVTSYTDTTLEGVIDVEKAGNLLLTVPADPGWTICVNGEEIEADTLEGAFWSIPLDAGHYEIRMKYSTPNFVLGLLISLGCIGIFVCIQLLCRKNKTKKKK